MYILGPSPFDKPWIVLFVNPNLRVPSEILAKSHDQIVEPLSNLLQLAIRLQRSFLSTDFSSYKLKAML